ncbi:hypothetical protein ACFWM0_14775 [Streptomyces sp. NPDC058405]|uniref:hypothetical protein n=1 Tax=Streptomyces sp. NPDC058405 TaxID=3346482 RepID=UPI0036601DBC
MSTTRAVTALAALIHDSRLRRQTDYGVALDVDRAGMLMSPEAAAELTALRALLNAQPAELTAEQTDALAAAGNRAVNDAVHEDLCMCDAWPEKCVSSGNFFQGYWDTSALDMAMPAVIALWEVMRNDRHAAKVAELRARVAELEAQRERRRIRLIALQNDAINMRGALSPNGEARKVPMPLGETLTPAVEWLINRVAELEAAQAPAVELEPAPLPHHPEHDAIKRTAQTRGRLTITPPVSPYWTTADYAHETEALRTLVWPVVRKALAEGFPGFSAAFTADDIDICVHCRSEFEFATDAEAADPSTRTDEHSVGGEPVCCKAAMDAFRAARRLPEADL